MKRSRARSPEAIEFAGSQRAGANEFTGAVWQWIRNRQICNQKFRREYPIFPYTADFCCVALKLIIEIELRKSEDAANPSPPAPLPEAAEAGRGETESVPAESVVSE